MAEVIKIKKGLDIRMNGEARKAYTDIPRAKLFAVKPGDWHGLSPKTVPKPGDKVRVGSPLFYDKSNPGLKFCSPVSGKLLSINRAERRRITEVVVEDDGKDSQEVFLQGDPDGLSREQIVENLLNSGLWPLIRQRPYSVIARPDQQAKSVFISAFSTQPLAPDMEFVLKDRVEDFQWGVKALRKLTEGKVYLNLDGRSSAESVLAGIQGVELHAFKGPHPAGNVGIQIHALDPVNKGDVVWVVQPQDVVTIGRLFKTGRYDPSIVVALTGAQMREPAYVRTIRGSAVAALLEGRLKEGNTRIISGSVLNGTQVDGESGYLGFLDGQLCAIREGNEYEMFGWLKPGFRKMSVSRSFVSTWLRPKQKYNMDTNCHGGERAFLMTGEYEKVLPMDIYPVQLLKSILVNDIDKMEQLGIYELDEEDLALCEFVCTSKTPVTRILRDGLNALRKEMED
ncbi:MAG: NADH:ubiquinone reductase (Na(+)-transporting) subunit A [Bacteroidetes bacterium]|nr:MAG: NADH:ubiquinone reductase (Na(+)-transporting) subunit A [Bacteroidota bacterium]